MAMGKTQAKMVTVSASGWPDLKSSIWNNFSHTKISFKPQYSFSPTIEIESGKKNLSGEFYREIQVSSSVRRML